MNFCLRLRSGTVQIAPKVETTRCLSEVEGTKLTNLLTF